MTTYDVATTLAKLPPHCFARTPQGRTIRITRGEAGYEPVLSDLSPEMLNAQLTPPPTPEQVEAMVVGSMFGWNVPGADPEIVGDRNAAQRAVP